MYSMLLNILKVYQVLETRMNDPKNELIQNQQIGTQELNVILESVPKFEEELKGVFL